MAEELKTVEVSDREGNKFEVPVGADGKNPASPDNPPQKALLGAGTGFGYVNEGAVEQAKVTNETIVDLSKVENKDGETADKSETSAKETEEAEGSNPTATEDDKQRSQTKQGSKSKS